MLILTRRIGESLVVGDNIIMTVLGVKGGQVRIGINAPKIISVHREEIYERIKNEQSNLNPTEDDQSLVNIEKVSYAKKKDFYPKEEQGFKSYKNKSFESQNNLKNFDQYKNYSNNSNYSFKPKENKENEDSNEDSIGNM